MTAVTRRELVSVVPCQLLWGGVVVCTINAGGTAGGITSQQGLAQEGTVGKWHSRMGGELYLGVK